MCVCVCVCCILFYTLVAHLDVVRYDDNVLYALLGCQVRARRDVHTLDPQLAALGILA